MPKKTMPEPAEQVPVSLEPAPIPVPIPRQTMEADVVPPTRKADEHEPFLVRVRDPQGKLLFCYNARTDAVEIKNGKGLYSVPLKDMRAIVTARVFSSNPPRGDIMLDENGVGQTIYNHPATETAPEIAHYVLDDETEKENEEE